MRPLLPSSLLLTPTLGSVRLFNVLESSSRNVLTVISDQYNAFLLNENINL